MPIHAVPVVLPYRLSDRADAPQFTLHCDTAASSPQVALSTAKVLCRTLSFVQFGQAPQQLFGERARVAAPTYKITGPYAYVFTRGDRIPMLSFPRRITEEAGQELGDSLAGLDDESIHGIVVDCVQLAFVNTNGLAAFMEHHKRINLHLCRVPKPIFKVMDIIGISKHLSIHPDMRGALEALIHSCRSHRPRLEDRGFVRR